MNIVGIGGVTGLPVLLRGLNDLSAGTGRGSQDINVSAIVTVADSGGSSGLLRTAFGIPAVGDLRNCLVASSQGNPLLADLFQYRFASGDGLEGHSLGNLIVTALWGLSGNLGGAATLAAGLLGLKGRILPATETEVTLCAEFENGTVVRGEAQIALPRLKIKRLWLEPENPLPSAGVLQTIACADAIVFGPGSLYSSVVANLLVPGIADAIRNSSALKIFVCNLMTEPGEADGVMASDHVRALESYLGPDVLDICLMNSSPIGDISICRYQEMGSEVVRADPEEIARMGLVPVAADLCTGEGHKVRHHSKNLARLIVNLTRASLRARDFICGQADLVA